MRKGVKRLSMFTLSPPDKIYSSGSQVPRSLLAWTGGLVTHPIIKKSLPSLVKEFLPVTAKLKSAFDPRLGSAVAHQLGRPTEDESSKQVLNFVLPWHSFLMGWQKMWMDSEL